MFCQKCGSKLPEGALFCQKCGEKLITDVDVETQNEVANAKENIQGNENQPNIEESNEQNTRNCNAEATKIMLSGSKSAGSMISGIIGCIVVFALLVLGGITILSRYPIVGVIILIVTMICVILKFRHDFQKLVIGVVGIITVAAIVWGLLALLTGDHQDKYVEMVKKGTLEAYPQKTVGEAFDNYLNNATWESGLSENGQRFVNVRGEILYLDDNAEIIVQFVVDKDDETYTYNACEIDGVPQNDYFVWMLFETVYGNGSGEKTFNTETDISSEGRTQSYNNDFGNISIALDYAEFVDQIESALGEPVYPDEDCIFLRIAVTVENIGTETGGLPMGWNEVVYDGTYEFPEYWNIVNDDRDDLSEIKPLTAPKTGVLIFMVPLVVAESNNSLVLNINDIGGTPAISYVLR